MAKKNPSKKKHGQASASSRGKYPKHSVGQALRIPTSILDQNAGRPCSVAEAATFVGVAASSGPFGVEISSATKYGLLDRLEGGKVQPSDLAKQILRPQSDADELAGLRSSVLQTPDISEVYKHYRGENLPDDKFFKNTVVDTYKVPEDKFNEFKQVFIESLERAKLLEKHGDKYRVVDVTKEQLGDKDKGQRIKKLGKDVAVTSADSCFVMQPFKAPLGDYYEKAYKPAIEKAGLKAVRADAEIFGTGKIMDQIWSGINKARVLVAELTNRNPNVFYELGLAHALRKPVVLVSSNEGDVPFDLQHIRVIYYDMSDPFWGNKLVDKVAENILSALQNPNEAVFPVLSETTQ
jgi:hypothetical protein